VKRILHDFFRDVAAPGYLVYEEYPAAVLPADRAPQVEIREGSARASYPAKNLAGTPEQIASVRAWLSVSD
jgi:hypothetical protein